MTDQDLEVGTLESRAVCQVKRRGRGGKCAAPTGLIYCGQGLCEQHWDEFGNDRKKLRKKLGLSDDE